MSPFAPPPRIRKGDVPDRHVVGFLERILLGAAAAAVLAAAAAVIAAILLNARVGALEDDLKDNRLVTCQLQVAHELPITEGPCTTIGDRFDPPSAGTTTTTAGR